MKHNHSKKRILLVEDESGIRKGLTLNLRAEGFEVAEYADARSAYEGIRFEGAIALGIVDIMMPGEMNGLDLCRRLREENHTFPVIFLTARNRLEDKLEGFEAGADDYLTKPFDLEELLARIHARLRTHKKQGVQEKEVRIGSFLLDMKGGSAQDQKSGKVVRFNDREWKILSLLIKHRGRPVSRDTILDLVWGTAEFPTNRTIDNYIVKFRKIFEPEPQNPKYIITRHGTGYELAEE